MALGKKKDNSTLSSKVLLRKNLLREIPDPVVMETHGGLGRIFDACYRGIANGVVFEKDPDKAAVLGKQRPTWAVYEADCIEALRAGVGAHLAVNFVDLDPYGEPWHVIDAFFESERPWPRKLGIAAQDGLRLALTVKGAWDITSMRQVVEKYGSPYITRNYLDICQELLTQKAGQRVTTLARWAGHYAGEKNRMTHYAAVLEHA